MKFRTIDITLIALFVSFSVISVLITRYLPGVIPISLLPFISLLAGSILGSRLGSLSMAVYTLIGLVGVPVFANPPFGGFLYVLNPTFGFVLGFIAAAYVSGWIIEKWNSALHYVVSAFIGIIPIYAIGVMYFFMIKNIWLDQPVSIGAVLTVFIPYLVKDLGMAVLAAVLAIGITRRMPQLTR